MCINSRLIFLSATLTLSLVACGGGGGGGSTSVTGPTYTGSTSPAAISSSNAEPVGKAAADAAAQNVGSETVTGANPFGITIESSNTIPTAEITRLTSNIARQALEQIQSTTQTDSQNVATGLIITSDQLNAEIGSNNFCGGSVTIPDNTNFNGPTLDLTMTFNNLCFNNGIDPQVTMNGTMRMIDTDTSETIIFSNLTVSILGGESYTLNATTTCDLSGFNCTVDFNGTDGTTYRMGNLSVIESVSGISISGTFYHPDYGSVALSTTTPMTFNCAPSPQPDTGVLAFSGDSGTSGSITFQGCSNYMVCYNEGSGEICNAQAAW
jgi:hypothetical protein